MNRVWICRVGDLEGSEARGLVSGRLQEEGRVMKEGVVRGMLRRRETAEEAAEAVRDYLKEAAEKELWPTVLEVGATAVLGGDVERCEVQHTMTRITYVVFVGRRPGIYHEWHECHWQVIGFRNCLYKKFNTCEEAEMEFLKFWGLLEDVEASSSSLNQRSVVTRSASSTSQSSTQQAAIPNEGRTRDDIIYVLAIVVLILSLRILFG